MAPRRVRRHRAAGTQRGVLLAAPGRAWPPPGSATRLRARRLARLAHIRAVLAARLWLQASPAWGQGQAWWHSELRIRAARLGPVGSVGHLPDAEIHWPSLPASPYPGQVWAVEVELTSKPLARTTRIGKCKLHGGSTPNH